MSNYNNYKDELARNYNDIYSDNSSFWGETIAPSIKYLTEVLKSGKVLDLGCGQGKEAFYLASKGFDVTAIDFSKNAINYINKVSKEEGFNIKAICQDISKYKFHSNFDTIISLNSLHFLREDECKSVIEKMKIYTNSDGINVITGFVEDEQEGFMYKFKPNELRDIYSDWKVIKYFERNVRTKNIGSDNKPVERMHAVLVAKKI